MQDASENESPLYLAESRSVQTKTYALQTLTGKLSKWLGTSVTAEDFESCCGLAKDAAREVSEIQALLSSINEQLPEDQQGAVQKQNHRVMLQKMTSDLFVTARVLEHVVHRLVPGDVPGNSEHRCADVLSCIQNVCAALANVQVGQVAESVPTPLAFAEGSMWDDLPTECLLSRNVLVRDRPLQNGSVVVKLPAGFQVTVLEVIPGAQGHYEWGHIREALGCTGFIVLRDMKHSISFVQRKNQGIPWGSGQYAPGEYTLTRDAAVNEEPSHESRTKGVLLAGTQFTVLEVITLPEVRRIRARMVGPGGLSGFVTLRYADIPFVRLSGEDSSEPAAGATVEADVAAGKPAEPVTVAKADIFEAAEQFATNAISKMEHVLASNIPGNRPRDETYTTGDYVLVKNAAVTEGPEFASKILVVLVAGTRISVTEVINLPEEQRIRGRMTLPAGQAGFISLSSADHVFARRAAPNAPQSGSGMCLGPDAAEQVGTNSAAESDTFESAQKFASHAMSLATSSMPALKRELGKLPDRKMPNLRTLSNLSKMPGLSKVADLGEAWRKNSQDHIL